MRGDVRRISARLATLLPHLPQSAPLGTKHSSPLALTFAQQYSRNAHSASESRRSLIPSPSSRRPDLRLPIRNARTSPSPLKLLASIEFTESPSPLCAPPDSSTLSQMTRLLPPLSLPLLRSKFPSSASSSLNHCFKSTPCSQERETVVLDKSKTSWRSPSRARNEERWSRNE